MVVDDGIAFFQTKARNQKISRKFKKIKRLGNKTKNEALKQQRMEETREALADIKAGRLIDGTEVMDWLERWGNDDEKALPGV